MAASAAYLDDLRTMFGNLGLAAAAYNAGEDRVRDWLAGTGSLPYETQDYVYSITGHGHDEWKAEGARFDIPAIGGSGTFADQCRSLVMRELSPQAIEVKQANWKPWGVLLTAEFFGSPRTPGLPCDPQPVRHHRRRGPPRGAQAQPLHGPAQDGTGDDRPRFPAPKHRRCAVT